ncbi:carbapenem biosynthesis protein CpmE [Photorhabdus bodei]|uniref:2Fe-2S iron-sulfur cluster binding domain-containing protein n=1 Tax=Photorhabdus bodei TaxID=2029681 RepID=A0A329X2N6_9GAMM|nr:carbapenem biosynthesis protein CpmE [Photorhabdus bodei]NDK97596.1 2Fe-2S iron-sulfur cluster binding domain-containing protein [Photorhabdus bodei]NDL01845.1 2Fe-2S iron-sulfur cluster binding domain-containing protein [Photorhabdus bodei]NDL08656.1 2Fe-2S iron-sulfur cluster binding domain-containing protein [Photorhabdus bodei]RAX09882.1 ferredoxin [Photorhabdus bodei]
MDVFKLKIGNDSFDISSNETILKCAYNNGVKLKYHCASGYCGKCKVKLISGEVNLDHSGGISRDKISSGYILTCCSYPKSNIEI